MMWFSDLGWTVDWKSEHTVRAKRLGVVEDNSERESHPAPYATHRRASSGERESKTATSRPTRQPAARVISVIARGTSLALRGKILVPYARAQLDSMQFEIPGWQHAAENLNSVSGNFPAEPTLELVEDTLRQ